MSVSVVPTPGGHCGGPRSNPQKLSLKEMETAHRPSRSCVTIPSTGGPQDLAAQEVNNRPDEHGHEETEEANRGESKRCVG